MISRRLSIVALALAGSLALTACETTNDDAVATDAEPVKKTRLDDFEPTGVVKNCISLARIDQGDVIDDQTILFEMKGNDYYVNRLPYRCPQLGFEERYTYATSLSQLCNTDIITVLTTVGRGASCGLGKFEQLKKKEEDTAEE